MRICPAVAVVTAMLVHGPIALAQSWTPVTESIAVTGMQAAYDPFRDRTILTALGGQTWEHDGQRWLSTGALPVSTTAPAIVYQHHRGRVLACVRAGQGSASRFETWEYDGAVWTQRVPDHVPPARFATQLAYDTVRQRVVMFSGAGSLADTWEWDGADWLRRLPAHAPPPRANAAMAFDPVRNRTLLFGGRNGIEFADHWEWDGVDWVQRVFPVMPLLRSHLQMAYDAGRNRIVLYGGYGVVAGNGFSDPQPWEFDGQQWLPRTIATAPSARLEHAMVAVGNGLRIFGGLNTILGDQTTEIFDYDGVQFTPRHGVHVAGSSVAFDALRNRTVMLGLAGSTTKTFEWDGSALLERNVPGPSGRYAMALTGGLGGGVFGFGGWSLGGPLLADSWSFQGSQWQQVATSGPPLRSGHAMATDLVRSRIVLFGGLDAVYAPLGDTWEWNGAVWSQVLVTGPPARVQAAMAFDPSAGVTVLHGGTGQGGFGDTWQWDGTTWTLTDNGLGLADEAAMAWSPALQALVLLRRRYQSWPFVTTAFMSSGFGPWWPMPEPPQVSTFQRLAADPNGHAVLISGADGRAVAVATLAPAQAVLLSPGCSFANRPARLITHDAPRLGARVRVELLGAEAGQVELLAFSIGFGTVVVGGACVSELFQPELLAIATTSQAGQVAHTFDLPNNAALFGWSLGFQSVLVEPQGPIFHSLALSDGLRLAIGH